MNVPPEPEPAQWREALRRFARADEDLRARVVCATDDPPVPGPAAYHCQQAAEKLLKGLLVAAAKPVPRTHDLKDLANRAMPDHPRLAEAMLAIQDLTTWATIYRYPSEEEDAEDLPTRERIMSAVTRIEALAGKARREGEDGR